MQMDIESVSRQVSTSIYEVIAYFGSACLALVLVGWGILDLQVLHEIKAFLGTLGAAGQAVLLIAVITVTYVYGQFASALSSSVIGIPVHRLVKRFPKRTSSDFNYDFSSLVSSCSLDIDLPAGKKNNKWTLVGRVR